MADRPCYFCSNHIIEIDFTDVTVLRRMVSEKGRIRSRQTTGTCRRHQHELGVAIKRAREMALLPLVES